MRGRSIFAACSVALLTAAWFGCGGSTESPGATSNGTDAGDTRDADSTSPDASNPSSDAGSDASGQENEDFDAGPPVTIEYGACQDFTPCGGNIVGSWNITSGCVSSDTFASLKQGQCAGIKESNVVIKAAGTLVATDTTITRKTKVDISADAFIPAACAAQALGNCQLVATTLSSGIGGSGAAFDKATCTSDGAGGCNCSVSKSVKEGVSGTYTASGNTITTTNPTRTFDYCVDGSNLTYKETTSTGGINIPIIVELGKN